MYQPGPLLLCAEAEHQHQEGIQAPLLGADRCLGTLGATFLRTLRASSFCRVQRGARGQARGTRHCGELAEGAKDFRCCGGLGRCGKGLGSEHLGWTAKRGLELVTHGHQGFKIPEKGLAGTGGPMALTSTCWCFWMGVPGLIPVQFWETLSLLGGLPDFRLSPQSAPAFGGSLPCTLSPGSQAVFVPMLLRGGDVLWGHRWLPGLWLVAPQLHSLAEGDRLADLPLQEARPCRVQELCLGEQHGQQQTGVSDVQAWKVGGLEQRWLEQH